MTKPTFAKLNLKKQDIESYLHFGEKGDIEVAVKQYLPIDKKIEFVTNVLKNSIDDNNFINPIKVEVFTALEFIYNYTNIVFTEKQKEDPTKIFDLIMENELYDKIYSAIPTSESDAIENYIYDVVKAYNEYQTSALGILEKISTDYSDLDFDVDKITKNLKEPANLQLLKDTLEKLG